MTSTQRGRVPGYWQRGFHDAFTRRDPENRGRTAACATPSPKGTNSVLSKLSALLHASTRPFTVTFLTCVKLRFSENPRACVDGAAAARESSREKKKKKPSPQPSSWLQRSWMIDGYRALPSAGQLMELQYLIWFLDSWDQETRRNTCGCAHARMQIHISISSCTMWLKAFYIFTTVSNRLIWRSLKKTKLEVEILEAASHWGPSHTCTNHTCAKVSMKIAEGCFLLLETLLLVSFWFKSQSEKLLYHSRLQGPLLKDTALAWAATKKKRETCLSKQVSLKAADFVCAFLSRSRAARLLQHL